MVRQQKQESEATAGWKRVRPTHLPLPPYGAAEPDRRCNCALQGTPSGPPGNSPLTWTHSRLLLRLLRRSDFYGSTPSSSGFMALSATSGPQPCLPQSAAIPVLGETRKRRGNASSLLLPWPHSEAGFVHPPWPLPGHNLTVSLLQNLKPALLWPGSTVAAHLLAWSEEQVLGEQEEW